ncbi:transposase [Deinococcus yavapaiensis]|uniref:transposase n=1 Tax=Deinococcus yavapaiensis TaxID=309889 RepID=UPI003CCC587E
MQWAHLEPLLPKQQGNGRPYGNHHLIVSGIVWVLRTGAPWRDAPECFGEWTTVYCRFRRWIARGVWQRIFQALRRTADEEGRLDWSKHFGTAPLFERMSVRWTARRSVGAITGRVQHQDSLASQQQRQAVRIRSQWRRAARSGVLRRVDAARRGSSRREVVATPNFAARQVGYMPSAALVFGV